MAPEYVVPYIVSNAVGLAILGVSLVRPHMARWSIALLFSYACVYNIWIGLTRPEEYQGFAQLAWFEWYREYITGPFKHDAGVVIPLIALGQGVIAATMAVGKSALWIGVVGACVFLVMIAPLGVGSAFPFSLTVSAAAIVTWRKLKNV